MERTDTNSLLLQFQSFNEDDAGDLRRGHMEIESEPAEIEVDAMRMLSGCCRTWCSTRSQALGS